MIFVYSKQWRLTQLKVGTFLINSVFLVVWSRLCISFKPDLSVSFWSVKHQSFSVVWHIFTSWRVRTEWKCTTTKKAKIVVFVTMTGSRNKQGTDHKLKVQNLICLTLISPDISDICIRSLKSYNRYNKNKETTPIWTIQRPKQRLTSPFMAKLV